MKIKFENIFSAFRNSQLFVSLCAVLLGAESYFIAGFKADNIVLAAIFFATLFIYNSSRLSLNVRTNNEKGNLALNVSGGKLHVMLAAVSLAVIFILMTKPGFMQVGIFTITAFLSLAYMMPFRHNGKQVSGIRNHLIWKNIILSLTWSLATVVCPLHQLVAFPFGDELIYMFMRRFFFIYSLTVIFDVRDIISDARFGTPTIAGKWGLTNARLISFGSLLLFILFTAFDPYLANQEMIPVKYALYLSGITTTFIIFKTAYGRSNSFYTFVVDGAMALQFLLIILFSWHH
jgi:hypothetical protein